MQTLPWIEAGRALFSLKDIQHTPQHVLKSAVGTGLFISLFFVLFRPFGMTERIAGYQWLIVASFGPLNTLFVLTNELGIKWLLERTGVLKTQSKTENIIWFGWTLLFIVFGNFFYYQALCGSFAFGFYAFLQFSSRVLLVGLVPIAFGLMYYRLQQKQHSVQTGPAGLKKRAGSTKERVKIQSGNGNEVLEVDLNYLLFIRSQDNYISIVQHKGGKPHLHLLRQSLKGVEAQLKQVPVVRCHRSFIVNLRQAETLRGNAQGMRLLLNGYPETIPVSRKYIATVKAILQHLERD